MTWLITLDCDQGWVLCQRESLWFAPFVQFLQHLAFALTLCPLLDDILNMSSIERGIGSAIRNWEKNTSTAPLHGRIFILICLQHSQGDLFSRPASERTMTLTDSCCVHHLKWLPTQHLYIWCVFLLNPGVYMPLLIMFFQPYANQDLMKCAFLWLGMCAFADGSNPGKTICGQWVNDVCMGIKAIRQRSNAVLNFHVGVIN